MFRPFANALKREFQGYSITLLRKDIMAGVTVAAVALPLALAFAVSSGVDASAGLITAILSGFIMSGLSGGYYQISGPTGTMAAILLTVGARYGIQGVFMVTFLAGFWRLLAGIFRLGKLTSFIPAPVVTGFTSGIAIIIGFGQIDNFFGVHSEGVNIIERFISYGRLGFSPDVTVVCIGLFVIVFMMCFPAKWSAIVPSSLLAIVIATAVSSALGLDVATVGAMPKTLIPENHFMLSSIRLEFIKQLFLPSLSIAALGMIETLLCGASAGQMTGVRLDRNQELIAQGVGNMIIPFFGGIPATAALARTSMAIKSGAQTRLTGVFHGVGLLICMFGLGSLMAKIPLAALAGVLMVTAWRMNDWEDIRYIFTHKFKGATLEFVVTMAATIIFDLTVAILLGVLIGLLFLVTRLSRIEIHYEDVDMSRISVTDSTLCQRYSNAIVVYITGPVIFANTESVSDIALHTKNRDTVLFSMRGVSNIDISGVQTLMGLLEQYRKDGVDVAFCGLPEGAMNMMRRSDMDTMVGKENFYWSVERALLTNRPAPPCTIPRTAIEDE